MSEPITQTELLEMCDRQAECIIAILGSVYDQQGNHAHPGDETSVRISGLIADVAKVAYLNAPTPEKRVESGEQNPKSGGVNDLRTDSVTGGAAFPTNETPHCTCTPYKDSKCIFHSPQPPAPDWAEQGMTKRKCVRCGRKILLSEHSNVRYCSERCSRAAGEGR